MNGSDAAARQRDRAAYYDREAPRRAAREIDPERVIRRGEFIDLLVTGGRRTLLEIGTGPGQDAAAFVAAGLAVAGVDLSAEHTRLARDVGVDAQVASVLGLPYPDGAFSAGWTMSTLLHVANTDFDAAMAEITRVLAPGALLAVGLWGGEDREGPNERDTIEPPRFFSIRSDDRLAAMLAPFGEIDRFETWSDTGVASWHYQWVLMRARP